MKIYNSYIVIVASLFLLTTIILGAVGAESLDVYYTLFVIEALVVTELCVYFNSRARRGLTVVSGVLFAGFLAIVLSEVVSILV